MRPRPKQIVNLVGGPAHGASMAVSRASSRILLPHKPGEHHIYFRTGHETFSFGGES